MFVPMGFAKRPVERAIARVPDLVNGLAALSAAAHKLLALSAHWDAKRLKDLAERAMRDAEHPADFNQRAVLVPIQAMQKRPVSRDDATVVAVECHGRTMGTSWPAVKDNLAR